MIKEVNLWAERATNGLIKDPVRRLDVSDVLVLANALYFKGVWKEKFHPIVTQKKKSSISSMDKLFMCPP